MDGDPTNNAVHNLRYGTRKDNSADAKRHGRRVSGERVGTAKLTWAKVESIRKRALIETRAALARDMNCSTSNIHRILHNQTWVVA